jgi:putative peptidoglycan lipid II flippase
MIFKNSLVIGIFTAFSVILGVFRDRLLAGYVGVGQELDIYNAAFRIPDLTLGLLFAFVSSATVIPFLSSAIKNNTIDDIEKRLSTLFVFFGVSMLVMSLAVVVALPYIANIFVPGFNQSQRELYVLYTRILMVQPILLGLSTLVSTYFQARQRFYIYGTAPLLYTSAIIGSILLYPKYGLSMLIFGVVFGALLHFALQSIALLWHGIQIRPKLFSKALIYEQLKISVPRSGSVVITQLRNLFFASFATTLGVGALSSYMFALRVKEAILLLIPQTLATASIPLLSQVSEDDGSEYIRVVKKLLLITTLFSSCVALVVAFLRDFIVSILFGQSGANALIAQFLAVFMVALPFACANYYISNALSASRDTKTYFFANVITTPLVIVSALYMKAAGLGVMSLAYSVALASILIFICIAALLCIKNYVYKY